MTDVQSARVKEYWSNVAEEFDAIYSGKKSAVMRWLDRVFRKDMYERFRLTIEECEADEIKTILDIGTGSGRFCLPLAEKKAKVMGIDFSESMIELARRRAEEAGTADKCDFRVADFLQLRLDQVFDAVLAIGVFDYVKQPGPFLEKMSQVVQQKVVTTFPSLWTWRVIPRWIRLNLKGCPVYFFTRKQIRRYHDQAGLRIQRFERIGKIYFVVASPS
ncbi:MAG: methyltransferase domain-containing protein [Bacteroidetes bacterium]|nr:methyltransferase domain-containing protein [Bacteroidota bacterium]